MYSGARYAPVFLWVWNIETIVNSQTSQGFIIFTKAKTGWVLTRQTYISQYGNNFNTLIIFVQKMINNLSQALFVLKLFFDCYLDFVGLKPDLSAPKPRKDL